MACTTSRLNFQISKIIFGLVLTMSLGALAQPTTLAQPTASAAQSTPSTLTSPPATEAPAASATPEVKTVPASQAPTLAPMTSPGETTSDVPSPPTVSAPAKRPRRKAQKPAAPAVPTTPTGEAVKENIDTLSLKQAVEMALDQNPVLREAREKIRELDNQVPVLRSHIFPALSFQTSASHAKDAANSNIVKFDGDPYNQYVTGLHLDQPVFAVGLLSAVDSAKNDRDSSKLAVEISERDTLGLLIQDYFNVVLAARSLKILEDEFKVVKEVFDTSAHRARIGRNQILDALQAKTQAATLDAQIQAAKSAYQVAVATLANQIGDQKLMNFKMKDALNVPSLAVVDKLVNLNNYKLPELEQNKLAIQKVGLQKDVFLGTNLPTLAISADLDYTAYKKSDVFDNSAESWTFGLVLKVPIFSGLSTLYQMRSYASQEVELELERRNVQNGIDLKHVSSRKTLESAEQSILLGEEAYKLGRASSEEAKRGYRLATIDFLQFLQVETSYLTAQNALNTYKYNYMVALANYYSASGQNMSELVGLLEELNK